MIVNSIGESPSFGPIVFVQAKDLVGLSTDESKDSSISREEKWQEKSRVDKDDEYGRLAVTNLHKYHPTEKMSAMQSQEQS